MLDFNAIIASLGVAVNYEEGDVVRKVIAKPNGIYCIYYNQDVAKAAKLCRVQLTFAGVDEEGIFQLESSNVLSVVRTLAPYNLLGLRL
jgi:hypothetical protein